MLEICLILILTILYISYIICSYYSNRRHRSRIKKVIHVNGIRGKSTVTRLIDAGLRECGYKVFSKTTGTIPTMIDTNNKEIAIKRLGPANIKEQLKIVRRAAKENADFLVIECMAVNPNYQYISEHRILKSDITVITNVRRDHLDLMGETKEEIAYSLANTIPNNGVVVLGEEIKDSEIEEVFEYASNKVNSRIVYATESVKDNMFDTFKDNINISLAVCKELNLDTSLFLKGMEKYYHDPGSLAEYKRNNTIFINGLSINDPDSIILVYNTITNKYGSDRISIVLNSRNDRPFRIKQHIEMIKNMKYKNLYIVGSNKDYIRKSLYSCNIICKDIKDFKELESEEIIFGIGNIASDGMKLLEYFKGDID